MTPRTACRAALLALLWALSPSAHAAGAAPTITLVACAPGYPGSTAEAQPTMDAFAAAVRSAAGLGPGELTALYHETEAGGLARFAEPDAALALVPLPFYLAHRRDLGLTARLAVVPQGGAATETWSLVAHAGALTKSADLEGWRLASLAAYAPRFVRDVALGGWGPLPASVELVAGGAALSGLRKAAGGEKLALLLDGAQTKALPSLPFAKDLAIVATSPPVPGSLFCSVGKRLPAARIEALSRALLRLEGTPEGAAALVGLRLSGFAPLDAAALGRAERAYDAARP